MTPLEQRAAQLFPHSVRMQQDWIRARQRADTIRPKVVISKHAAPSQTSFARTLKEAFQ